MFFDKEVLLDVGRAVENELLPADVLEPPVKGHSHGGIRLRVKRVSGNGSAQSREYGVGRAPRRIEPEQDGDD